MKLNAIHRYLRYLFRIEHIALDQALNGGAEYYVACAQLNVTDGGNGTPGPLVEIPGVYTGQVSDHFEANIDESH
jgi:hypothetical protein